VDADLSHPREGYAEHVGSDAVLMDAVAADFESPVLGALGPGQ
jgi:hypothetical protein